MASTQCHCYITPKKYKVTGVAKLNWCPVVSFTGDSQVIIVNDELLKEVYSLNHWVDNVEVPCSFHNFLPLR